jgi:hypothetical protein
MRQSVPALIACIEQGQTDALLGRLSEARDRLARGDAPYRVVSDLVSALTAAVREGKDGKANPPQAQGSSTSGQ